MSSESLGTWIRLGDAAEGFVVAGRVVALVYSENIGPVYEDDPTKGDAYELWWVPVDAPEEREVLFGVGDRAATGWETRWEGARRAGETLYEEHLRETRR